MTKNEKQYLLAETFVGAGGNHIGWKKQGFKTVYVNDFDENMINTITYNNPELKDQIVDSDSILDLEPKKLLKKMKLEKGELDVLFGGIVCKGFSLAGERNPMDERNFFYHSQLELVKEWRPKVSAIENVSGILSGQVVSHKAPKWVGDEVTRIWEALSKNKFERSRSNKKNTDAEKKELEIVFEALKKERQELMEKIEADGYLVKVIDDIKDIYKELGYRVYVKTLKSSEYGVASIRKRVFIIAVRNDVKGEYKFPEPKNKDGEITVRKALKGIKIDSKDQDSLPMKHTAQVARRFSYIPQGKNISDVMDSIPQELRINKFFSRGSNMRLSWDVPAPTLVPGHSAFPLHPEEHRSITVREAACITGFPKDYKFFGNHSKRCEQVGNAIPPKLAESIAESVKELLDAQ